MTFAQKSIRKRILLYSGIFVVGNILFLFLFHNQIALLSETELRSNLLLKSENHSTVIISETAKSNTGRPPEIEKIKFSKEYVNIVLSVLVNGGTIYDIEQTLSEETDKTMILPKLEKSVAIWIKFREKLKNIETEPYLLSKKIPFDTLINGNIVKRFKTVPYFNPKISESVESLYTLNEDFRKVNAEIVNLYQERADDIRFYKYLILFFILANSLVYLVLIYRLFLKSVFENLFVLKKTVESIIDGKNAGQLHQTQSTGEFIPLSDTIDKLAVKLEQVTAFLKLLEKNDLTVRLPEYSKKNPLDSALVGLRRYLKKQEEEENQRLKIETIRQWSLEGQNRFNDILRSTATDFNELADKITQNIVQFLNIAQGGLFIFNDVDSADKYLELKSAYAYDRKKFLTKKIAVGEGLIGMCALEKNMIYLESIPEDYMEIESGLGDTQPASLLIIPLKTDNDLLGVIEIASFNKFQKHEIDFIENVGQNIAATLRNSRISARTAELLREAQKKSEELAVRDAEMQKNIREMRSAQEEAHRKEAEMSGILIAVDTTLLKAEFQTDGTFTHANRLYVSTIEYHFEELKQKRIFDFFSENEKNDFVQHWDRALQDNIVKLTHRLSTKSGRKIWLNSQFSPVKNEKGTVVKILYLGNDITERKEIEERNNRLLDETIEKTSILTKHEKDLKLLQENLSTLQKDIAVKETELHILNQTVDNVLIKAEYNARGTFLTANSNFYTIFKFDKNNTENTNIRDFIPKEELTEFEAQWSHLHLGVPFSAIIKRYDAHGNELHLSATYTPVEDVDGVIRKIVFLAHDLTPFIENTLKINDENENLRQEYEKTSQLLKENETEKINLTKIIETQQNTQQSLLKTESPSEKKYYLWLQKFTKK